MKKILTITLTSILTIAICLTCIFCPSLKTNENKILLLSHSEVVSANESFVPDKSDLIALLVSYLTAMGIKCVGTGQDILTYIENKFDSWWTNAKIGYGIALTAVINLLQSTKLFGKILSIPSTLANIFKDFADDLAEDVDLLDNTANDITITSATVSLLLNLTFSTPNLNTTLVANDLLNLNNITFNFSNIYYYFSRPDNEYYYTKQTNPIYSSTLDYIWNKYYIEWNNASFKNLRIYYPNTNYFIKINNFDLLGLSIDTYNNNLIYAMSDFYPISLYDNTTSTNYWFSNKRSSWNDSWGEWQNYYYCLGCLVNNNTLNKMLYFGYDNEYFYPILISQLFDINNNPYYILSIPNNDSYTSGIPLSNFEYTSQSTGGATISTLSDWTLDNVGSSSDSDKNLGLELDTSYSTLAAMFAGLIDSIGTTNGTQTGYTYVDNYGFTDVEDKINTRTNSIENSNEQLQSLQNDWVNALESAFSNIQISDYAIPVKIQTGLSWFKSMANTTVNILDDNNIGIIVYAPLILAIILLII